MDESGKLILQIAKEIDPCQRLIAVPGIGPLTATATIAAIVTDRLSRMAADLKPGWGSSWRAIHRRQGLEMIKRNGPSN